MQHKIREEQVMQIEVIKQTSDIDSLVYTNAETGTTHIIFF